MSMTQTYLLDQVQFSNILSLSILEDKLGKNFENIIEYLRKQKKLQDQKIQDLTNLVISIRNQGQGVQSQRIQKQPIVNSSTIDKDPNKNNWVTQNQLQETNEKIRQMNEKLQKYNEKHNEREQQLQEEIDKLKEKLQSIDFDKQEVKQKQEVKYEKYKTDSDTVNYLKEIQRLRQELRQSSKKLQIRIKDNGTFAQPEKNLETTKEKLKQNFQDHQRIKKELEEELAKKIEEIGPQLKKLMERSDQMKSIEEKMNQINKIMDEGIMGKVLELSQNIKSIQNQDQNIKKSVNIKIQQLKLYMGQQFNSLKEFQKNLNNLEQRFKDHQLEDLKQTQDIDNLKKKVKNQNINQLRKNLDSLREEVNELRKELNNNEQVIGQPQMRNERRSSREKSSRELMDVNFKDKINDKINKINQLLLNFVSKEEFEREKEKNQERFQIVQSSFQKIINQFNKKIQELWEFLNKLSIPEEKEDNLKNQLNQIRQNINHNNNVVNKRIDQINDRIDAMKKQLFALKDQFESKNFNPVQQSINQESLTKDISGLKKSDTNASDLKRQIENKLHDFRKELLASLRQLQRRFQNNRGIDQQLLRINDRIQKIQLFLGKKADSADTKKSVQYLDERINKILKILEKESQNSEDARGAKRSLWYCLSCDKQLQNYTGKIGKHIPWDGLPKKFTLTSKQQMTKKKQTQLPNLNKI